jgi:hypothetical protein
MKSIIVTLSLVAFSSVVVAQPVTEKKIPSPVLQMKFIAKFDSGQKDASIYKMVDPSDDVICYILMPEFSSHKVVDEKFIYEANSIGSISCLKGRFSDPRTK